MRRTIFAAAIAFFPATAYAGNIDSGWQLYAECTSMDDGLQEQCLNYIRGVWDGVAAVSFATKTEFICSGAITAGDMRKVFLSWARKHPDKLEANAVYGVSTSYMQTFSCGKGM